MPKPLNNFSIFRRHSHTLEFRTKIFFSPQILSITHKIIVPVFVVVEFVLSNIESKTLRCDNLDFRLVLCNDSTGALPSHRIVNPTVKFHFGNQRSRAVHNRFEIRAVRLGGAQHSAAQTTIVHHNFTSLIIFFSQS